MNINKTKCLQNLNELFNDDTSSTVQWVSVKRSKFKNLVINCWQNCLFHISFGWKSQRRTWTWT